MCAISPWMSGRLSLHSRAMGSQSPGSEKSNFMVPFTLHDPCEIRLRPICSWEHIFADCFSCLILFLSFPLSENFSTINHCTESLSEGPNLSQPLGLAIALKSPMKWSISLKWKKKKKSKPAGEDKSLCAQGWPEQALPLLISWNHCSPELDQWF